MNLRGGIVVYCMVLYCWRALNAQSEPQYTQYMYHRYLFNPAYAGSENAIEFSLLHRSQYVGLSSAFIATQAFNFSAPIEVANSGIGLNVTNDFMGYQRSTGVSLHYNYRKKFKWGNLAVGLGGGVIQTSIQGNKLRTPDGSYIGNINHEDEILPNITQSGVAPDLAIGIYFNHTKYFAGAALNHIIFTDAVIKSASGSLSKLTYHRNLFFTGGYMFTISKKLQVTPTLLVKTDLVKAQGDLSLNFTIINNILTGISFRGYTKRAIDALAMVLGCRYKGFQLVYSYDANISYLSRFNTGSHEVSLTYKYPIKKKEAKGYFYYNPRFY